MQGKIISYLLGGFYIKEDREFCYKSSWTPLELVSFLFYVVEVCIYHFITLDYLPQWQKADPSLRKEEPLGCGAQPDVLRCSRVQAPSPGVARGWKSLLGIVVSVCLLDLLTNQTLLQISQLLSNRCNPMPGESREGECWMQGWWSNVGMCYHKIGQSREIPYRHLLPCVLTLTNCRRDQGAKSATGNRDPQYCASQLESGGDGKCPYKPSYLHDGILFRFVSSCSWG